MGDRYTKLFSIVIPTYNYGHYLARAINSVCIQPGNDYEIIVVDDGSTDDTAKVVRECHNEAIPLTYAYQQNGGLSAARNLGIRLAKAQFLLFLDADDALLPHALTAFRSVLDSHEGTDFVLGGWVRISSKGSRKEIRPCALSPQRSENFVSLLRSMPVAVVNGSNIIHRRVFERLKFPESVRLWEDRVFYAHLLALYSGLSIADPVVQVYRHADSLSHNVDLVRRDGLKTIDLLFDPSVLPPELMSYKDEYAAVTQRILFDALYVSGVYQEAREAFNELRRLSPKHAFTIHSMKRYLTLRIALMKRALRTVGR